MKINELLDIAVKAGEILIKGGAEIYRVEDTLRRICLSYGVESEPYVLLSGIFLHARGEDGAPVTVMRRIQGHVINLQQVHLVNSFSRSLADNPLDYGEALKRLEEIEKTPVYPLKMRLSIAGIIALIYTLLFNGSFEEAGIALLISVTAYYLRTRIANLGFFQFFEFFIAGLLAGGFSLLGAALIPGVNIYKVIIGAIMVFVPGLAITNGIKDALYGDVVSSLYRIAEAVFTATAIGAGVALVLAVGVRFY